MLKKSLQITGLLVILFTFNSCGYNHMVALDEEVKSGWAQVENAYQRRADLIPNLVNTVKGAANFEQETITKVIEARSKATGVTVDASKLTPESIQKFQEAQNELSGALSRLMVSVERYPELKATQAFMELQSQLEGTENRISVERKNFNETVKSYNTYIRKFPANLIAGMFKFEQKGYFEADKGSDKVPTVDFGK